MGEHKENIRDKFLFVDSAKGVGIVLVVLGHALQTQFDNYDNMFLFRIIYSFHMPLFMFLSGILAPSCEEISLQWVMNRAKRLVVPFVTWAFIAYIYSGGREFGEGISYFIDVMRHIDKGMWFLWSLFLCCVWLALVRKMTWAILQRVDCNHERVVEVLVGMGMILLLYIIPRTLKITALGFQQTAWYYLFYYLGTHLKERSFVDYNKKGIAMILLGNAIVFTIMVMPWRRGVTPAFLGGIISGKLLSLMVLFYRIMTAICGISVMMEFVLWLSNCRRLYLCSIILGTYTMEIYVLHMFFFNIIHVDDMYGGVFLNTVMGLFCPIALLCLIKSKYIGILLFGRKCYSPPD